MSSPQTFQEEPFRYQLDVLCVIARLTVGFEERRKSL